MDLIIVSLSVFLLIIVVFLLFYRFIFLRNPVREIPYGNYIVSPADGNIGGIFHTAENDISIEKGLLGKIKTLTKDVGDKVVIVLIIMNVWHVHYQRAPIEGKVIKTRYKRGKFQNAVMKGSSFRTIDNERNEILFKGKRFKVKIVQIAGLIARRIICFVKPGEKVMKGQHVGLIRLGSQVALIMPGNVRLKVRKGEPVKGGSTIIAEYDQEKDDD